jgi:hypothetical protein
MRKNVTVEEKTRAIQGAVREAIREHALLGRPVCVWRDDKVVWSSPEEVLAEVGRSEAEFVTMTPKGHHD